MSDVYVIDRPNRALAASRSTRVIVALLLAISAAVMLIIMLGSWSNLQGSRPVQVVFALLYILMAYLVTQWNRGVLPVATAFAILLLIFAIVAGPEWLARDRSGFATPETPFGTTGLEAQLLGLLTFILIPLQLLLMFFAMSGFRQEWQVEIEVPKSRARWPGARPRIRRRRPGERRGPSGVPTG